MPIFELSLTAISESRMKSVLFTLSTQLLVQGIPPPIIILVYLRTLDAGNHWLQLQIRRMSEM